MDERIAEILGIYRETIKPLLADIRARRADNKLPDNFLNEIRALNDHIARCYRENIKEKDIDSELTKAEGHLRRLIYDCFKQLNIYISDILERKERIFYSDLWLTYDGGNFWNAYSKNRKYAQQNVIEAKKMESMNPEKAMYFYEEAFKNYREAENLLIENKAMLYKSCINRFFHRAGHLVYWLLITVSLSVISALIGFFVK